jgi:dCMP deaminase
MNKTEKLRPSWDEYGMILAYAAASRSPDPYVNVGAVAFRKDRSTVSTGYNGAASGVEIDWSDRDFRRRFVVHAERNCLKYAKAGEPYYLYVTLSPCLECLSIAKTYGVKEIVYDQVYERDSSALTKASDYGITLRQLSLKDEHLKIKSNIV